MKKVYSRQFLMVLCLFTLNKSILAWDNEELELFDLVEEVNANFYDVLGVEQSSTSAEIRRAYRKLSLKMHPDKNKEEGAEEKFRQIVAVYEILKDEQRRQQYNEVLVNGLPDWRTPVYYYRKARKLGLVELAILLLIILTIGHFIVIWSMYLERKFELEEVFSYKKKKDKKGKKAKLAEREAEALDEALQEHISTLHRPTLADLIPCKMILGTVSLVTGIPQYIQNVKQWQEERHKTVQTSDDVTEDDEDEVKRMKRRQRVEIPDLEPEMATDVVPVVYMPNHKPVDKEPHDERVMQLKSGSEWTDHEISLLAKAVTKFPSGASNRWERIAEMVGRTVSEVTTKSKEIKSRVTMTVDPASQGLTGSVGERMAFKKGKFLTSDISQRQWSTEDEPIKDTQKSSQTNVNDIENKPALGGTKAIPDSDITDGSVWTQSQQKALEIALSQYPKGTPERWEKVSGHITGKTKDDCIARFKYLAETIKRRKLVAEIAKR